MGGQPGTWVNWSGGQQCRPRRTDRPLDAAGVVAAVRRVAENGARIRPVGAGLSASGLVLTDDVHVDCSALTGLVAVAGSTVRVRAGETLARLLDELAARGRTLATIPTGTAATVGGAVSTGTHGGPGGSLSAQVLSVRLVDGTGTLRTVAAPDELDAVRTGLGLFGVITEVELQTVPAEPVAVFEEAVDAVDGITALDGHPWAALSVHLPSGAALLRRTGPVPEAVAPGEPAGLVSRLGQTATSIGQSIGQTAGSAWSRRPAPRWEPGTVGLPHELLPSPRPARVEATSWAVPRGALGSALRELGSATAARELEIRRPVEIRLAPAEPGWLHPAYGRDTAWITVQAGRSEGFAELFALVGSVLEGEGGRPHWAGRHDWSRGDVALAYPRYADFEAVRARFDPSSLFLPRCA